MTQFGQSRSGFFRQSRASHRNKFRCIPTTRMCNGSQLYGAVNTRFPIGPLLHGDFDSFRRPWGMIDEHTPAIYDEAGENVVITGDPHPLTPISLHSAGSGRMAMLLADFDIASIPAIACYDENASLLWEINTPGRGYSIAYYVDGHLYTSYRPMGDILAPVTVKIDAETGNEVASFDGLMRSIGPRGRPIIFTTPNRLVQLDSDLTTELWSFDVGSFNPRFRPEFDGIDTTPDGVSWITSGEIHEGENQHFTLTTITLDGVLNQRTMNNFGAWTAEARDIKVLPCLNRLAIHDTWALPPEFFRRYSTIRSISLSNLVIDAEIGDVNFFSDPRPRPNRLRVNGKWNNFT